MAKNNSTSEMIGGWSFIVGALIALILGVIPSTANKPWVIGLLLVLGVIVGLINITDKEIVPFLIACVAFLVAAPTFGAAVAAGGFGATFSWLTRILTHIGVFVVPAAVIASIKAIMALAGSK
ncbi:hypothetical protein J4216_01660 [Candidatus Woesearchaeota archaeon]|nr:hypothetical protein [Candidatus Woesearchaeota archaeon]